MRNINYNKILLELTLCILIIICGCVAPMARISSIKNKDYFEIGGGPLLFNSIMSVDDTTSLWGGHLENATYLGLQGNLRLGYGFSSHFGVDLTLSIVGGTPLSKEQTHDNFVVWTHGSVFCKTRPWRSNNLFLLGIENPGILTLGWVHGWPAQGEEHYSTMIELANQLPAAIANEWRGDDFTDALLPSVIFFTLSRNYYFRDSRLSPNLAFGAVWDWDARTFELGSIMLGVNWAP